MSKLAALTAPVITGSVTVDGITILLEEPGTEPVLQFPAVFQSVVPAPPVHSGN